MFWEHRKQGGLFDEFLAGMWNYLIGFTMRRFYIKIADFVKKGFITDF